MAQFILYIEHIELWCVSTIIQVLLVISIDNFISFWNGISIIVLILRWYVIGVHIKCIVWVSFFIFIWYAFITTFTLKLGAVDGYNTNYEVFG